MRRKLFTLPDEVAERLGKERNQSAFVVEALKTRWSGELTLKRLVEIADNLEKQLSRPGASKGWRWNSSTKEWERT